MTDPGTDAVLGALADPTRRALLDALAARGQASASVLAADLPVSRQAIVKHLGVLSEAGLVEPERSGREVRYTVRSESLAATASWMSALADRWDRRLRTIKRAAEQQ
ncbi:MULTISPECIES: ArsR/SmtB family transcription factor [Prauserella salsuginis group]|uniref:ArsR/SmtB family transcription factor n=1 Tax=Prauserella salsuginis TaxID=387889 RepID=A0ABW6FY46_9PSEU|nr:MULTISPECIES: metalloregulator ArsR/SmtB family transcription factor [Prauserella salsuginis group]